MLLPDITLTIMDAISGTITPFIRLSLQKTTFTRLLRNVSAPLTSTFLIIWVNRVSSRASQGTMSAGGFYSYVANPPLQVHFSEPSNLFLHSLPWQSQHLYFSLHNTAVFLSTPQPLGLCQGVHSYITGVSSHWQVLPYSDLRRFTLIMYPQGPLPEINFLFLPLAVFMCVIFFP